jgi:hypothetical protein
MAQIAITNNVCAPYNQLDKIVAWVALVLQKLVEFRTPVIPCGCASVTCQERRRNKHIRFCQCANA